MTDGAYDNSITDDVISGNNSVTGAGVHLNDDAHNNVVAGDKIGTDATGTVALGNAGSGVIIDLGSYDNTIGGTTAAAANVISGNKYDGVHIESGPGNVVEGNFIGTDITGTHALGNAEDGVNIDTGTTGNIIGGTVVGARNIISANGSQGIELNTAVQNVVEGNFIGTDVTGTHGLGNGDSGILVASGADNNILGGTAAAACNIISANGGDGIHIDYTTVGTLVEGNYIGTNVTGTKALGNSIDGVGIDRGSNHNTVGGTTVGARNVISSNAGDGVDLEGPSTFNLVEGNYIGTNAAGTAALGNINNGVLVQTGGVTTRSAVPRPPPRT